MVALDNLISSDEIETIKTVTRYFFSYLTEICLEYFEFLKYQLSVVLVIILIQSCVKGGGAKGVVDQGTEIEGEPN